MTTHLAVIANEPTPYRLHLHRRLSAELPGVQLHSIFTHRLRDAHAPWKMEIDPAINPVFFEDSALAPRGGWWRARRLFHHLRAYLAPLSPLLIVLNGYNDAARIMLIRWAHHQGRPLALRGDSNVFGEGRLGPIKAAVKRHTLRWLLRHVDAVMPMGTAGRAFFRAALDHDRPEFLCPYEPDYAALRAVSSPELSAFRKTHGLDPQRRHLLYCGRLIEVKRVDLLLDAFAGMSEARPDWDLLIAGDGPMRVALQARIPPAAQDRVRWLGFLQFDQTAVCYHAANVLVHPSQYEPWALVINEAVAAGLALVATNVTGAAIELVRPGVNGELVPPGDVRALTDALLRVTDGDTARRYAVASADVLRQWQQTADPVNGVRQALRLAR